MSGFRGLIASASLKRDHGRRLERCGSRKFPRLDCLGLIEAMMIPRCLTNPARSFRGLIASASLKLISHHLIQNFIRSFRGLIASASLKRRHG